MTPTQSVRLSLEKSWPLPEGLPRQFVFPLPLPQLTSLPPGRPLVWDETEGEPRCLCVIDDSNEVHWAFPVESWLEDCRNMVGREPKQSLYSKIPFFSVNYLPPFLRDFLFQKFFNTANWLQPDWEQRAPLDGLNRAVEAIAGKNILSRPVWPMGKKAALTISLDVDSPYIFTARRNVLRDLLEAHGLRAAWFFLSGRYELDHGCISELQSSGHEIAWHGHNHDHRMGFVDDTELQRRLTIAQPFFEKYQVQGMRMENFLWSPRLLDRMTGFMSYDASMRNSFPMAEDRQGSATSLPFQTRAGIWEVPTTVTGDHCLPKDWPLDKRLELTMRQIDSEIALGGVAHLIFHPEPDGTLLPVNMKLFERVLEKLDRRRDSFWHCLPVDLYRHCASAKVSDLAPKLSAGTNLTGLTAAEPA